MNKELKYKQVYGRIMELVENGTFHNNTKVPSVRDMSRQMNFSMMTVLEGYNRLVDDGILENREKSGFYVLPAEYRSEYGMSLPRPRFEQIDVYSSNMEIGEDFKNLLETSRRPDFIRLGSGSPSPEFFPGKELALHMSRAARNNFNEINLGNFNHGHAGLRKELSGLMMSGGTDVSHEDIIVTSGATQALLLALKAVTKPGDTVAVESPGYYGYFSLLEFLNIKIMEIPICPQSGLSLKDLETVLNKKKIAALITSPSFQNPTGATMTLEKRGKLCALASKFNLPVIEDDVFGELSFSGTRLPSLKSICQSNVIYISSLGKILAPGYRIGWISGGKYHKDIERCFDKGFFVQNQPCQYAAESFLKSESMNRHLKTLRRKYAENIRMFRNTICENFPSEILLSSPEGGVFLWMKLPDGVDSRDIAAAAAARKISIAPGVLFSSRGLYSGYVRLNAGVVWSSKVKDAIVVLGNITGDLQKK